MPYTEEDLRSMLRDSAERAPVPGDLAGPAARRGRTVRRRRRVAATALTVSAVATIATAGQILSQPEVGESGPAAAPAVSSPSLPPSLDKWDYWCVIDIYVDGRRTLSRKTLVPSPRDSMACARGRRIFLKEAEQVCGELVRHGVDPHGRRTATLVKVEATQRRLVCAAKLVGKKN